MTDLWLYGALLILAGVLFLVWPVWKARRQRNTVDRTALNVALYEERVAELGAQRDAGEISPELHDIALEEAGKLLLEDTAKADEARRPTHRGSPIALLVAAAALPLVVVGLYMSWGNPAGLQLLREMQNDPMPADLVAYIDRMERITEVQPQNGEVWYMLGRAYLAQQRPADAANAFGNSMDLMGVHPEVLAQYAQARFFANDNKLDSEAADALSRALEMNPNEPTALGLLGINAFEAGDYAGAISYWERLQAGMPPGSEGFTAIQGGIDRARERMGEPADSAAEGPQIAVRIELAAELAEQYPDDAVVFVSAREPQGPPMPLLALRLNKSELPVEVALNSSHALMPGRSLEPGQALQISARISTDSDVRNAGHQSEAAEVKVGEQDRAVVLQIDRDM